MSQLNLHTYLLEHVEGFKQAQQKERDLTKAAFILRDWVSSICSYPGLRVILKHDDYNLPGLLLALLGYEGGVWCGGCAKVLAEVLRACTIPAITYGYGFGGVSHFTTIFSPDQRKNYYVLDAYLNYHYTYKGSTKMIPLGEMLHFIRARQYDKFQRVDTPLRTRHLVTDKQETAMDYAWLFDRGVPRKPTKVVSDHRVYSGVSHSVAKVLMEGCAYRLRADEDRGDQDLNKYFLDLMLVNPYIGRAGPAKTVCYPDITVLRYFVLAYANRRPW